MGESLLEKDVVLALARRLRGELEARGIHAILLRDNDADLSTEQRAVTVNAQRAVLYIAVHAGRPGRGVRVFTSMLEASSPNGFVEWQQAQAPHVEQSLAFAGKMAEELGARSIPTRRLRAALPPMDEINAPAVAIELAPQDLDDIDSVANAAYQQNVAAALAKAIAGPSGERASGR